MTSDEFDQRLKDGHLTLTLVGMSNVGKSYWSGQLARQSGFHHYCCDDLIEAELSDVLQELGYKGIADMSKWLGQPYDERFAANQQTYLDLESATLRAVISELEQGRTQGNTVIDTTGSVVHTDPKIQAKLNELTTVIYLEATDDMREEMFKLYIAEPKPVVWGDIYKPETGESPQEALARCYPDLLSYRSKRYAAMSSVTIPRTKSLQLTDSQALLDQIKLPLAA